MPLDRANAQDEILADLQQARNLRILVLDSCRDNPLADELKRSIGSTRALPLQRGLALLERVGAEAECQPAVLLVFRMAHKPSERGREAVRACMESDVMNAVGVATNIPPTSVRRFDATRCRCDG